MSQRHWGVFTWMLTSHAWRARIPRSPLQGELPKAEGVPLPIDNALNHRHGCSLPHVNRPKQRDRAERSEIPASERGNDGKEWRGSDGEEKH